MKKRVIYTFILSMLIGSQLILTPLAYAEPAPTLNSDGTLTLAHSYPETSEPPILPETITQDGQEYTLDTTTTVPDPTYVRPSKVYTHQAFSEVPLEGFGNWGAYFPATFAVSDGEYQGEIGLDPTTPFIYAERYHSYRIQVDREVVIPHLPDNDVTRIPASQSFEVTSEITPGATQLNKLELLYVYYEVAGRDHLGLPNNYTAYVTYRGQEGYHELAWYDVLANYSGELVSSTNQMALTARYSPVKAVVVTPIAESQTPLSQAVETPLMMPFVIIGAAVIILILAPLLFFLLLTNARMFKVLDSHEHGGDNPEEQKKETIDLVCRKRLVLREGIATFTIPSRINILADSLYHFDIKPRLADREGKLMLVWQGKVVALMPLARKIDINFNEVLITSVENALIESDLL